MPPIVKTCEIHGESLVEGLAHVVYGLRVHYEEYSHAVRTRFLRSLLKISGGCVGDDESPTTQKVWYCRRRRDAERTRKPFRDTFD